MAAVRFAAVSKWFGSVPAVLDLDLTVADGEFLVLVGPSGCGKTTALRMVAGLEQPSAGAIWIGDAEVTDVEPKDRDIGMVFQNYALYPHMTVFDNLAFGLRQRKTPKREIGDRVREVAALLAIEELLQRRPRELSGGQRQRVALGRAIVRRPRVYLMDEPLSNLDAQLRAQTRAELVRLHRQLGTTTIFVTHDQVEAMTMGSRIAVMEAGRLRQVAPPQQLYDEPADAFVARFIGSPPMNLLPATPVGADLARVGDATLRVGRLPLDPTARLLLGFRPEQATLAGPGGEGLAGVVDLVERLGSDALVTVTTAAGPVVVRADARHPAAIGDLARVAVAPAHLRLFDADTGLRLTWAGTPLPA